MGFLSGLEIDEVCISRNKLGRETQYFKVNEKWQVPGTIGDKLYAIPHNALGMISSITRFSVMWKHQLKALSSGSKEFWGIGNKYVTSTFFSLQHLQEILDGAYYARKNRDRLRDR